MSLTTHVSGTPAACHRSARQLADLAAAAGRAATAVAHRSRLSSADFGGRSGDAFRGHAGSLAERLATAADRCRRVARAMERLGDDLDEVSGLMERARAAARSRRLVVHGEAILAPGAYADAEQHDAWRELGALVAAIRQLEQRAQRDWEQALAGEALVPAPSPAAGLPSSGDLTVPAGPGAGTPAAGSPPTPPVAPGPLQTGAGASSSPAPATQVPGQVPGPASGLASPPASGGPAGGGHPGSAPPAGPTTWAAEQLGVHAEPWPSMGAGVALGFEEVSDGPR